MTKKDFTALIENINAIGTNNAVNQNIKGIGYYSKVLRDLNIEKPKSTDEEILIEALEKAVNRLGNDITLQNVVNGLQSSTLTSYYTPDYLINSIVNTIKNSFDNDFNNILEPSAGDGRYIGPLLKSFPTSNITAIEKEFITGNILKKNHPKINVNIGSFEKYSSGNNDLVISNIPFGNINVFDKELVSDYHLFKMRIHNYFFLKGIKELKETGILAFITTQSLMNTGTNLAFRKSLFREANLISAIRLDNDTFSKEGTKVVSDLIILQKSVGKKDNLTPDEELFCSTSTIEVDNMSFTHSDYFKKYKHKVLGKYAIGGFHQRKSLTVNRDRNISNIEKNINDIIFEDVKINSIKPERLLNNDIVPKQEIKTQNQQEIKAPLDNSKVEKFVFKLKDNNLFIKNSKVFQHKENQEAEEIITKEIDRISKLINLRNTTAEYYYYKNLDYDKAIEARNELNDIYDLFNFQYGNLNDEINFKFLSLDSDFSRTLSIEKSEKNLIVKSQIFTEELIISPNVSSKHIRSNSNNIIIEEKDVIKVERIDQEKEIINNLTIEQAISYSLNKKGFVDENLLSKTTGLDKNIVIKKALDSKLLFINPIIDVSGEKYEGTNQLVTKDEFESGYIEHKLHIYKKNLFKGALVEHLDKKGINDSIKILQFAKPYKLTLNEIDPDLGESWIPTSIYKQFAEEEFKTDVNISRLEASAQFIVKKGSYSQYAYAEYAVQKKRGTVYPEHVLAYALDDFVPVLTYTVVEDGKEVKLEDKKAMDLIRVKIELLNNNWKTWLKKQPTEIIKGLENKYHIENNSFVKKDFKGDYLDTSQLKAFTPHGHQKDGASQIIYNSGGIIDHQVGYGKTITMGLASTTMARINPNKKILMACMNANYTKIYEELKFAFPEDKIMIVTSDDLTPSKKDATLLRIKNSNDNIIVCNHNGLNKIPSEPEIELDIIKEENDNIRRDLKTYEDMGFEISAHQRKGMITKIENNEARMEHLYYLLEKKGDFGNTNLTFYDLGITDLMIDESQEFKNLFYTTRHSRVSGLNSQSGSQRSAKLLTIIRAIQKKQGGDKGITFSSGTTISNSLTELYVLFKYLRPNKLRRLNIKSFDQWARYYARKSTTYEQNIIGHVKRNERFRYFVKVPELAKLYNDIANVSNETSYRIDKPTLNTQFLEIEPYEEQKQYFDDLMTFMQNRDTSLLGTGKHYDEKALKAIGLIVTDHGRKASMDMRLIDPEKYKDHPNSKVNIVAKNVYDIYKRTDSFKGTQIIFSDRSTPNKEKFNIYDELKFKLIQLGIPKEEIEFIHDNDSTAKKKGKLFDNVNSGKVRIVFGSTQKLGTGVNMQERGVAMHHFDIPWRPSDFEQRCGRFSRQGNEFAKKHNNNMVDNFVYGTKGTTDGYCFNLLAMKQAFITQLKSASISQRRIDEGAMDVGGNMSFEDMSAVISNNTEILEKIKLEKEQADLLVKDSAFINSLKRKKVTMSFIEEAIEKDKKIVSKLEKDFTLAKQCFINKEYKYPIPFSTEHNKDIKINDIKVLAINLQNSLGQILKSKDWSKPLASNKLGFEIRVSPEVSSEKFSPDNYRLFVKTPNDIKIKIGRGRLVKDEMNAGLGFENSIQRIEGLLKTHKESLQENEKSINDLKSTINEVSPYRTEILKLDKKIKALDDKISDSQRNNNDNDENQNLDQEQNNSNKPKI